LETEVVWRGGVLQEPVIICGCKVLDGRVFLPLLKGDNRLSNFLTDGPSGKRPLSRRLVFETIQKLRLHHTDDRKRCVCVYLQTEAHESGWCLPPALTVGPATEPYRKLRTMRRRTWMLHHPLSRQRRIDASTTDDDAAEVTGRAGGRAVGAATRASVGREAGMPRRGERTHAQRRMRESQHACRHDVKQENRHAENLGASATSGEATDARPRMPDTCAVKAREALQNIETTRAGVMGKLCVRKSAHSFFSTRGEMAHGRAALEGATPRRGRMSRLMAARSQRRRRLPLGASDAAGSWPRLVLGLSRSTTTAGGAWPP